jgi:hypothetical protein
VAAAAVLSGKDNQTLFADQEPPSTHKARVESRHTCLIRQKRGRKVKPSEDLRSSPRGGRTTCCGKLRRFRDDSEAKGAVRARPFQLIFNELSEKILCAVRERLGPNRSGSRDLRRNDFSRRLHRDGRGFRELRPRHGSVARLRSPCHAVSAVLQLLSAGSSLRRALTPPIEQNPDVGVTAIRPHARGRLLRRLVTGGSRFRPSRCSCR